LRPSTANIVEVGFWDAQGCDHPNFLADNKRVVPSPPAEFVSGKEIEEVKTSQGLTSSMFVYNLYPVGGIRRIATAKTVRYEICDRLYSLSPQDQAYLREFLTKLSQLSQ